MDILIVDDHEALQMLLTTFLEQDGFTVQTASNGQEALSYLQHSQELPSLILLDIAMPKMTGWDFLKEQRRNPRLAAIPVVVMTALGEVHRDATTAAVAYVQKPLDLDTLTALLDTYAPPRLKARAVEM